MDKIPQTRFNSVALVVMYWKLHDCIDIPESLIQALIEKATAPETILRAQRKVKEHARAKRVLELIDRSPQTDHSQQEQHGGF